MYTAVCIIYIYRYLYTYTCLCIYISASRKLRLQRSAVYCLSWLFFFSFLPIFFLRIRFSLFSSPFSQPVSSSSFHPCLTLSISFPRPFSLFFFRLSKILQHLSSSEANTRPRVRHQLSRFRRRFLFPLVRRGWQFRGMSHRGAASRTNRSLVLVILKKTSLFFMFFFFCSFVLSFLFRTFSFYRSCAFFSIVTRGCVYSLKWDLREKQRCVATFSNLRLSVPCSERNTPD